ncbi:hypothetical protein OQA88_3398 [Cercophora sp. LCS_1]
MADADGSWIATPGSYQALARDLCASDPRLRRPDKRLAYKGLRWDARECRVILFEFTKSSDGLVPLTFTDPEELNLHILKRSKDPNRPQKAIYILENTNGRLVDILGSRFDIHPSMFLEYARATQIPSYSKGHSSLLASTWANRNHLWMNYRELILLPREVVGNYGPRCSRTGRDVGITRVSGAFDPVGLAHRKSVFWSKPRAAESGWDCIVICDPPVQGLGVSGDALDQGQVLPLPPNTLDGYVDFLPENIQSQTRRGPPRTSLADDLSFYVSTHGSLLGLESPDTVALFVKKIVASHYTLQFDYFRRILREVQRFMRKPSDFSKLDLASVEANWSDIQTIERRLDKGRHDLEEILLQLGASLEPPNPSQITSWQDVNADFQLLYHRFIYLQQSAERVNASITGLASIVGNRQAFKEQQLSQHTAEKSRGLTFIGLVFIPLAFVSSLFSMAEPYGPGGERFWLYFAISLPTAVSVMLAYYVFDLGYRADGSGWSISHLGTKVQLFQMGTDPLQV